MLELYAVQQIKEMGSQIIFQQMEHCHTGVQSKDFWAELYLEDGLEELSPLHGFQDLLIYPPMNFFLWEYVKDQVYSIRIPSVPNLQECRRNPITNV
jgi:hypothetical protein